MLSKKFIKSKILYFTVLLFFFNLGFSQHYLTQNLTTHDGLPDNNIFSILKDKDNNLWIGSGNGLTLIKGKTKQTFKKRDGLSHNSCWALTQDRLGQIWIGTFGGGVSLYYKGKFINFTTENGLPSNKIRKLFLKGDDLFIGTSNGFSKINIVNKKIKNYEIKDKSTLTGKKDFEVLNILEVKNKIVFNTHSHGIYIIKNDEVSVLNKSQLTTFSLFKNNDSIFIGKNGHLPNEKSILKIDINNFLDGKSNFQTIPCDNTIFWNFVSTNNAVVYGGADGVEYDTGGLFEITNTAKNINSIFGIENKKIGALLYDKKTNSLFIGTLGNGLYIIGLNKIFYKKNNLNTIDYKCNDFYEGVLLYKDSLVIKTKNKNNKLSLSKIHSIIKNQIDILPLAYRQNCDGKHLAFAKKGFILKSIELINRDILINTNYGLLKLIFNDNKIESELLLASMQTYKFDKESLFYYYPYFSLKYLPNYKDQSNTIFYYSLDNNEYPKNIFEIIFTENNKYFISKTGGLYYLYGTNYKAFEFISKHKELEFTAAYKHSAHQIILGTSEGDIYMLNDEKESLLKKIITKKDLVGNSILKILSYKDYVITFTEKGINILDLSSRKTYLIDDEMGIRFNTVNATSIYKNTLNIATNKGAYDVDLNKFLSNKNKTTFPYFIDKFIVNDKQILKNRTLNHKENKIRFELGSDFHLYPNKLFFQYKLKGLKKSYWSDWKNANTIDFVYIPPGEYELELSYKDLSNGKTGFKTLKKFEISTPFWTKSYFLLLSFITLVVITVIFIKHKKNQMNKRTNEKIIYEKRIVETKMEALQSQMNPHFLFNSLNVIQNFVIQNDVENSILYINKFSKLIRTTLENSSEFKISITEELEFLKLFVEVQNIRFNNKVQFRIIISPDIDKYENLIPPMLIQPLIENCFEHAFNETIVNPKIILTIQSNKTHLIISVTDNGIGFKNTANINKQSKALQLVEERIMLLDNKNSVIINHLSTGVEIKFSIIIT